jgi:hypothetical protein
MSPTIRYCPKPALYPRLTLMVGLTDLDESLLESGFRIPDYLLGVLVNIGI